MMNVEHIKTTLNYLEETVFKSTTIYVAALWRHNENIGAVGIYFNDPLMSTFNRSIPMTAMPASPDLSIQLHGIVAALDICSAYKFFSVQIKSDCHEMIPLLQYFCAQTLSPSQWFLNVSSIGDEDIKIGQFPEGFSSSWLLHNIAWLDRFFMYSRQFYIDFFTLPCFTLDERRDIFLFNNTQRHNVTIGQRESNKLALVGSTGLIEAKW